MGLENVLLLYTVGPRYYAENFKLLYFPLQITLLWALYTAVSFCVCRSRRGAA